MGSDAARVSGTLVAWNDARGFGFITPEEGGPDAFAHITDFAWGSRRPRIGQPVTFQLAYADDGRRQAKLVLPAGTSIDDLPRRIRTPAQHRNLGYLAVAAFAILFVVVFVERPLPYWVPVLYLGTSVVSFLVYAADKSAASAGRWRTSESTLLAIGLVGGWPGAVVAQRVLRHKNRKRSFQWAFWGTVTLNVVAFAVFSALDFTPPA